MGSVLSSRSTTALLLLLVSSSSVTAQQITVDITPSHAVNRISPLRALGAGIDRDPLHSVKTIFDPAHVGKMLAAGWGGISYRLNTELSIQAWHWNPTGAWSNASNQDGYYVGAPNSAGSIQRSFGYNLPHRGVTSNDGSSGGYSRLDDGDLNTYWKSNPYLSEHFTAEDDAQHPQWALIDLGGRKGVNEITVVWADPYAVSYRVQYWMGGDAIYDPAHGRWKDFPGGTVSAGAGGRVNDRVGVLLFTDRIEHVIPPRKGRKLLCDPRDLSRTFGHSESICRSHPPCREWHSDRHLLFICRSVAFAIRDCER